MSRSILLFCAIGNLLLIPLFSSAQNQNLDSYFEKRTAWGDPNIQGVWDKRTVTPLERPARFENRAFLSPEEIIEYEKASAEREDGRPLDFARTSISVHDPEDLDYGSTYVTTGQTSLVTEPSNGRIPYYTEAANERTEKARKMKEGRGPADSWIDRNLTERCLTWGVPQGMLPQPYNNNLKILQTPDHVMFYLEMAHDVRIVPLDGRPHLPENLRLWHGDSRGHWDDDTLVVRTKNFSPKSNFRRANTDLEIEERFRRNSEDQLEYTLEVKDDTTWVSDWTVSYPMVRSDGPIYEFACHEGNYGLLNILSVARNLEKEEQDNK